MLFSQLISEDIPIEYWQSVLDFSGYWESKSINNPKEDTYSIKKWRISNQIFDYGLKKIDFEIPLDFWDVIQKAIQDFYLWSNEFCHPDAKQRVAIMNLKGWKKSDVDILKQNNVQWFRM